MFFWAFFVTGFPEESAREWLIGRIEKETDAKVSIDELHLRWNLGVRFKGISIDRQSSPQFGGEAFTVKLAYLNVKPRLFSILKLKPELDFNGGLPSGGSFSGTFTPAGFSLSFKDVSFKDITIATLPVPSSATIEGSGAAKFIKGKGIIEIELEGIPGGKQRSRIPAGDGPGIEGKVNVTVSLPKM